MHTRRFCSSDIQERQEPRQDAQQQASAAEHIGQGPVTAAKPNRAWMARCLGSLVRSGSLIRPSAAVHGAEFAETLLVSLLMPN